MEAIANLTHFDATGQDSGIMTTLAMQLEACMLCDEQAQARYVAIYGEPWQSLTDLQIANDDIIASDGPITAVR